MVPGSPHPHGALPGQALENKTLNTEEHEQIGRWQT